MSCMMKKHFSSVQIPLQLAETLTTSYTHLLWVWVHSLDHNHCYGAASLDRNVEMQVQIPDLNLIPQLWTYSQHFLLGHPLSEMSAFVTPILYKNPEHMKSFPSQRQTPWDCTQWVRKLHKILWKFYVWFISSLKQHPHMRSLVYSLYAKARWVTSRLSPPNVWPGAPCKSPKAQDPTTYCNASIHCQQVFSQIWSKSSLASD